MADPLYLIDAYAQIYRGYYAMPPLSNAAGQPTSAVFAFAKFLLGLDKDYAPACGAVVFDVGKPVHRLALAPDYKAQRPPMPEDLKRQTPLIREWIAAAGWPVVECEGMEADDLIAGLAAAFADRPVRILSADKDLCQLVDGRVELLVPAPKGGFVRRGPAEVATKFGVAPGQLVDYLALIGDTSDNIPGVDGIGPKTAAKLIGQFGSLAGLLGRLGEVPNENLRHRLGAAADRLAVNRRLITLDAILPDPAMGSPAAITRRPPDWSRLQALAEALELHSIGRELATLSGQGGAQDLPGRPTPPAASPPKATPPAPASAAGFTPDLFG
jgi:DNA polymerase-1